MIAFEATDPGVTWEDASALTMAMVYNGQLGHLATITSAAENVFLDELREQTGANIDGTDGGLDSEFWIGGYLDEGVWKWVDGEGEFPADNNGPEYANWNSLEPNNLGGVENNVALGRYGDDTWNDEGYWLPNIYGFVVEFDGAAAVPEPSPFTCLTVVCVGAIGVSRCRRRSSTQRK